jgi:hypothetical protein
MLNPIWKTYHLALLGETHAEETSARFHPLTPSPSPKIYRIYTSRLGFVSRSESP